MRKLIVTALSAIVVFGMLSTASAGHYTYGPNGRLTYHQSPEDFQQRPRFRPGYYHGRSYRPTVRYYRQNDAAAAIGLGILGLAVGAIAAGAANQDRSFVTACLDKGGEVSKNSRGELVCRH